MGLAYPGHHAGAEEGQGLAGKKTSPQLRCLQSEGSLIVWRLLKSTSPKLRRRAFLGTSEGRKTLHEIADSSRRGRA